MILLFGGAAGGGWDPATPLSDEARLPLTGYENGHTLWMAWADGPMLRYGNWEWWDGSTLRTEPRRTEPGYPPLGWFSSLLDWLIWKRLVVEGKGPTDGLDAEIASLFDATAGNSRADADAWRHAFCVSFPKDLGATFARWFAVDTYAEPPSLPNWPHESKNSSLQPTGTVTNTAWTYSQSPRRHLCNEEPWDVEDGGGGRWTVPGRAVGGWVERILDKPVDNFEDGFDVVRSGEDFADARPFNGYSAVLPVPRPGGGISYDVSLGWRHYRAYIKDGTAWVGFADNALPAFEDADTGLDAESVCLRVERSATGQHLHLWFANAGVVKHAESGDEGKTWSVPTTVATGKSPSAAVGLDGLRWVYYIAGGGPYQVDGKLYDAAGVLLDTFTGVVTNVDDDGGLAVDVSPAQGGRHRVVLWAVSSGGSLTMYVSTDGGRTFS